MSIISALTYSMTNYSQTYDEAYSTDTNKADTLTSAQPEDTYESSSELIIFVGGEKEDGVLYYSYDGSMFPKMSAYNDGSLPYKLTISEVNAAGYQPKNSAEAYIAATLIASECGKKYGLKFVDGIPETAEGKSAYMKAFSEYHMRTNTWDVKNWYFASFPSSLNKVEGTDWWISDGAEALIGHEVLQIPELESSINEYGFRLSLPGKYQGTSFLTGTFVSPEAPEPAVINLLDGTIIRQAIPRSSTKTIRIYGGDGGTTYKPEIKYEDALGLEGMSMGERKVFLSTVQSILDKVAPGVDVKQLKFKTGYLTLEDARNGKQAVLLDVADDRILQGKRDEIEKAINKNTRIVNLKLQADASPNKSNGQLTISVLDASGQELPKNEVRLIADGKSITTTVETIKNMDQMQMLEFVWAS